MKSPLMTIFMAMETVQPGLVAKTFELIEAKDGTSIESDILKEGWLEAKRASCKWCEEDGGCYMFDLVKEPDHCKECTWYNHGCL